MRTRVTAILVAERGGEWLEQTIAGISAQSVAPATIVAVNNGGSESVGEQLLSSGADRVVGITNRVSFGRAVAQGVQAIPEPTSGTDEWLWLLPEDACPEPEALERILRAVQKAPSVAVAGPKLVDWDHPERIIELGQSLTRYGARWLLRRQELDQQQYDHLQDVLGVGPVGMLVRRDVWDQLGGFDPALPVYDDGLDFSVRARLAGYRVEVAPTSRVRFAQSGVAGPRIDRRRSVMRAAHRQARTSHLHRRIAYAPALVAFFEWLGLPLYAIARVLWALIREQPGQMLGEFVSAFAVFFKPHALIASRRRIRQNNTAGWSSIRQLRVDPKAVRTARMIDREAILASNGMQRRELHFISSGGLATLIGAVVAAIALTWWALPQTSLTGGGLAPLSPIGELWWNTRTLDGVPADPFTWVLALLGTLTFWNPSHAVVLFMILAIPLAALGGWIWAAQLTESRAGRALLGIGFALSPVLLGSIDAGRLPTLVLAVVLPWLLLAGSRCRESWSWAGTASLLAAVALASAPILIPAAIVVLVVGLFTTIRGIARVLTTALVPAVLFAPKAFAALTSKQPLELFMDPGIVSVFEPGTNWHLLLGFPTFGLEGWAGILEGIGLGGPPATLLVGVLMLPIALLALLGLFTGRVGRTMLLALLGGLGMITAVAAAQLQLAAIGSQSVSIWTGSGLALYWIAILGLAATGAGVLRRAAGPIVAVGLVTALVAIAPLGARLITNDTPFSPGYSQMPALVQAAGENDPGLRTIVIDADGSHSVRAHVVTGTGLRLDQMRTAAETQRVSDADRVTAKLVGGLASAGGADITAELAEERIGFVLLTTGGDASERAVLQKIFDQQQALVSTGITEQGLLWRVGEPKGATPAPGDANEKLFGTTLPGTTIWIIQLVVLFGVLLLALPTGEVTYRPERRRKPSKRRGGRAPETTVVAPVAVDGRELAEHDEPAERDEREIAGAEEAAAGGTVIAPHAETGDTEFADDARTEGEAHASAEAVGEEPAIAAPATDAPAETEHVENAHVVTEHAEPVEHPETMAAPDSEPSSDAGAAADADADAASIADGDDAAAADAADASRAPNAADEANAADSVDTDENDEQRKDER
ncbi:glycosyltransferase [Leucobacter sp. CSA2]|uniref:Glycosyltransferase n=1 Tax=Leucobacter edaphi TaxID=2796472 RepID=A0A934QD31_9MICO|nr:glycosyltransferase [Leucobacter edaphi]MBK0422399.1 glycosyltransferase [Leucobacter edaphi]